MIHGKSISRIVEKALCSMKTISINSLFSFPSRDRSLSVDGIDANASSDVSHRSLKSRVISSFMVFALIGLSGLATLAHAQNVLMLSTGESTSEINWARSTFESAGASVNHLGILGTANSVSASTFTDAPGPYDIVLVLSVYNPIHASNWAAINTAVANRASNAFLLFIDGCDGCSISSNADKLVEAVNAMAPFTVTRGSNVQQALQFPLNTASPFSGSFLALNPFLGGFITYIDGVPADNALYLAPGATIPPVDAVLDDVFGLLVPRSQSHGGAGACLFATVDMTLFTQGNGDALPDSFIEAATQPGGACGTPARVSKSFASSQVSAGQTTQLTITVENFTADIISGANLTDNLPTPLQVAGAASNTCVGGTVSAMTGGFSASLTNFSIPANSSCQVTVPVIWPSSAVCADTIVTNTITPGEDFTTPIGQVFTPASADLTCVAGAPQPTVAVALPINRTGLLVLLSLLLLAVGIVARRRLN